MISFEINQKAGAKVNKKILIMIVRKVEKILSLTGKYSFSFAIVKDSEIKKLNKAYRGKNVATDVLAFNFAESKKLGKIKAGEAIDLGEIIVSHETAQKQAKERGHSVQKEIQILFTHGLLHLLGFDHYGKKERESMFKLEKEALKR